MPFRPMLSRVEYGRKIGLGMLRLILRLFLGGVISLRRLWTSGVV